MVAKRKGIRADKAKVKFRWKGEPIKPVRKTIDRSQDIDAVVRRGGKSINLQDMIEWMNNLAKENELPLSEFSFNMWGCDVRWKGLEHIDDFNERMSKYTERMKVWEEWQKKFPVEIKEYKAEKAKLKMDELKGELLSVKKHREKAEKEEYKLKNSLKELEQETKGL